MRIVVVGDTLLDVDIDGSAERLSPDAPVPVLDVRSRSPRAGGAGLVATMLARDGADVALVTCMADDGHGRELRSALRGIDLVAGTLGGATPVKTRVRAEGHAIVRLDDACVEVAAPTVSPGMIDAIEEADAIVVADYGRGVAADPAVRAALERRASTVPVVWDPHPRGPAPVAGITVATPNRSEAAAFSGRPVSAVTDAVAAGDDLLARWGSRNVAVTLGAVGAVLTSSGRLPLVVTARAVGSADPCGAGDRLAATIGRELGAGASVEEALRAGVESASGFLASGGVARMAQHADNTTTLSSPAHDAVAVARSTREGGGTVIATGGCFDLLHAGHARTLAAARALGDCLIVCLNSDASVRRLKGRERPLIRQEDRVDLLLSLECVDGVLVFDEDTPEDAIRRIEPDIWVKGGDYTAADLPESRLLTELGGRVVTVPFIPARSTSALADALARVG